jgi:RHS repeat-associated protein
MELEIPTNTVEGKYIGGSLHKIQMQTPEVTGSTTTWTTTKTWMYTYYTTSGGGGIAYKIKHIIEPAGYASLSNPDTATEAQLLAASSEYRQYDSAHRVTRLKTKGGSEWSTIAYTENSNVPTDPANNWKMKAVYTSNDGTVKTVYSSFLGKDILVEDVAGSDRWITYVTFDSEGRELQRYSPAAIDHSGTAFDDSSDDLAVQVKPLDGRVDVTTWYTSTGSGGVSGRLESRSVKQGASGAPVLLGKLEYGSHSQSTGSFTQTVHPVTKQIQYRSDSGSGDPVETTFSYAWHTGTLHPMSVTTHLPNVSAANNGVSYPQNDTTVRQYNINSQMISTTDARGTVTEYAYDPATSAPIKTTRDAGTGNLNIVEDITVNERGSVVETLGPVHQVDGVDVRRASWTVRISENETWTAGGYRSVATGTDTLVNSVSISKRSADGTVTEQITATRGASVESAGALTASDSFPQSSWVALTRNTNDIHGRMLSSRVYHDIPAAGLGVAGTNFIETTYDYDQMSRQNRSVSPDATVHRTVYSLRGQVVSSWAGTNDTGATNSDPSGAGASGNNMVMLSETEFDNASDGGNGLQTKVTQKVTASAAHDRVTGFEYDWRGRLANTITTDGTNEFHQKPVLDNLNRATSQQSFRYDSGVTGSLTLIAQSESFYDERGRSFRSKTYAVSDNGVAGNALESNQWFDASGQVIKSSAPGSSAFSKTVYDALGRATVAYTAYFDGSGSDDPASVASNVVLTESHSELNDAGQVVLATSKDRLHDSSGTGSLVGPNGTGPKSRDSYSAMWYDKSGRSIASASYGTNDGVVPVRPDSSPVSSDTVLVSQTHFDIAGRAFESVDPADRVTRIEFDDAGRTTKVITNFGGAETQTVRTEYNSAGQMVKQIAENANTGDQETVYSYGVTLADSELANNSMLRQMTHPDGGAVVYSYDRAGQQTSMTDPNGTIHQYSYDSAGRRVADIVLTLGSGVDGAVRRIEHSYDNRMRISNVTSYDAITAGNIQSDIQYQYNDFGQVVKEFQQHDAAVDVSSSLKTEYTFADGSTNSIRGLSLVYPDGRELEYDYGVTGGQTDRLDRVREIKSKIGSDPVETLVSYSYSGGGTLVSQTYNEPGIGKSLSTGSGDAYSALDRFGRMVDLRWKKSTSDLVRFKYSYDRSSNRLSERNLVTGSGGSNPAVDSLFGFDELNRMTSFESGELNVPGDAVVSPSGAQAFTLDETGNYTAFISDQAPAAGQPPVAVLNQTRTHNTVNEVTDISQTVGDAWAGPAHDDNGNMTVIPQPSDLTAGYDATWDAWNRLVQLADDSVIVSEYAYDGINRRIVVADEPEIAGIALGVSSTDMAFRANRWAGHGNTGEFEVTGTYFRTRDEVINIGAVNNGISATDSATGTGYIMYSQEDVNVRFSVVNGNADHFVPVRLNGSQWQQDTGTSWVNFTPLATDRLVAAVDFSADTVEAIHWRHVYYSQASQAVEERLGIESAANQQFVWNLGYIDDLVLRDRDSSRDGSLDERLYSLADLRYSVMALADSSGTIVERYKYDAHGTLSVLDASFGDRSSSSYDWEFTYTGRRLDLESGLMYFRARYYHAQLGRFISRDPLGFVDGMSLYRAYFVPTGTDPNGHQTVQDPRVPSIDEIARRPLCCRPGPGPNGTPTRGGTILDWYPCPTRPDGTATPTGPVVVGIPKPEEGCEGFCIGATKAGGVLDMTLANCNITSFTADPNNSVFCPNPKSAKEGCKLLIKQLNGAQNGNNKPEDKGWAFNLCGGCDCDWDNGKWFKPADREIKIPFDKTWVGQHISTGLSTIKCRYQITGSITVKVKSGSVVLAPCKKK